MFLAVTGLIVVAASFLGTNELLLLLVAGIVVCIERFKVARFTSGTGTPTLFLSTTSTFNSAGAASVPAAFGLWPLLLFFLKVGSVLFGSGYVLLAFLRADLVERWHWLTEAQLLDAIAIGQITPGPVFTTATFIGYVLAGPRGALIATIGIFLPAFIFVAISGPLVPRMRRSPLVGAFLDGVVIASLGLMAVVTWQLLHAALVDRITLIIGGGECAADVPLQDQLCLAGPWRSASRLNVYFARRAPMKFRDSDLSGQKNIIAFLL